MKFWREVNLVKFMEAPLLVVEIVILPIIVVKGGNLQDHSMEVVQIAVVRSRVIFAMVMEE
ncbi:hypothetical protein [Algoriphagus sp.]|uniref:hypothetical protein n=1 Tax=Algoriphagus sp. TaxID=1872435 RepID=UPI003F6E631D